MFPGLSDAEIAQRRDANDRIKMVGERLAVLPGFAGVMVDWATGKVVVAATNQDTLEVMVKAVKPSAWTSSRGWCALMRRSWSDSCMWPGSGG